MWIDTEDNYEIKTKNIQQKILGVVFRVWFKKFLAVANYYFYSPSADKSKYFYEGIPFPIELI